MNPSTIFKGTFKSSSSNAATSDGKPPLTALAALVKAREQAASTRTFSHVSWLPDVLRIRGSIIGNVAGPVSTITVWAAIVAAATRFWDLPLRLSNSVVPLLSVVVGLLLVFRNGSAYERYSEGRKDFTALLSASRNLARLVWIQVGLPSAESVANQSAKSKATSKRREEMRMEDLKAEKIRFLKLIISFCVSIKHHLRGEAGTEYDDYRGILPRDFDRFDRIAESSATPFLPGGDPAIRSTSPAEVSSTESDEQAPQKSRPKKLRLHAAKRPMSDVPGSPLSARTPLLRKRTSAVLYDLNSYESAGKASLPLPLVIGHELSRSIYRFKRQGTLEIIGPAGMNAMQGLIQTMIDQLGAMERVVRTPLPPVFGVHLKQCVSLYLFSLPLVLVDDMGWLIIPVTTLVAFTLMGIEGLGLLSSDPLWNTETDLSLPYGDIPGIATEVENPFGCDPNDIPLDVEVAELRVELEYIISNLSEGDDENDVFSI